MLRLFSVAVTGSIASGKSTVCRFFEQWGAYVVDADKLLHQVFSIETPIGKEICSLFGESVLKGSQINRAKVAEAAFSTQKLLDKLEDICHPYVNQAIKEEYERACKKNYAFFAAEVPLLFESRFSMVDWFDATIVVSASTKTSRHRSLSKGLAEEQFLQRLKRQLKNKEEKATYCITNNGSLEELETKTRELFNKLSQKQE